MLLEKKENIGEKRRTLHVSDPYRPQSELVEISGKQELSLFIGEYLQGKQNFKLDILEI